MAPGSRVFVVASAYGGPARTVAHAGFMVAPDRADRGTGRLLAEHVLEEARRDGCTATVFNALVETNPALPPWRSLGSTVLGTAPRAYDHPRHGPVGPHILHRFLWGSPRHGGDRPRQGPRRISRCRR